MKRLKDLITKHFGKEEPTPEQFGLNLVNDLSKMDHYGISTTPMLGDCVSPFQPDFAVGAIPVTGTCGTTVSNLQDNPLNRIMTDHIVSDKEFDFIVLHMLMPYDEIIKSKRNTRRERRLLRRSTKKYRKQITKVILAREVKIVAFYSKNELVATEVKS